MTNARFLISGLPSDRQAGCKIIYYVTVKDFNLPKNKYLSLKKLEK
jgi:hypothetical protein